MISQFKSKKALKKIRNQKRKIRLKNIQKQLDRHRNSPKRRIMVTGDGMNIVPATPDPRPIDQEKV